MTHRKTIRTAVVGGAAAAALLLLTQSAHAALSTFTGSSSTACDAPNDPGQGTSQGNGTCETTATSSFCQTSVSTSEGSVLTQCVGNLTATTAPFFVKIRPQEQDAVQTLCFGAGTGTFRYRPSPTSPFRDIPVTIEVTGTTATFSGVHALGTSVAVVNGTYTNACGGSGTYGGEVL